MSANSSVFYQKHWQAFIQCYQMGSLPIDTATIDRTALHFPDIILVGLAAPEL